MNPELISLMNSTMLTMLVAGGLVLGYRFLVMQERRMRGQLPSSNDAGTGTNISIRTSPDEPESDRETGFQFFEVNELQKRAAL